MEDESVSATQTTKVQKLVTADGTYATQSAFDSGTQVISHENYPFFKSTKPKRDDRIFVLNSSYKTDY